MPTSFTELQSRGKFDGDTMLWSPSNIIFCAKGFVSTDFVLLPFLTLFLFSLPCHKRRFNKAFQADANQASKRGSNPRRLRRLAQEHADLSSSLPCTPSSSVWCRSHAGANRTCVLGSQRECMLHVLHFDVSTIYMCCTEYFEVPIRALVVCAYTCAC